MNRTGHGAAGIVPGPQRRGAWREAMTLWLDRHAAGVFLLPALLVVVGFAIFPLIVSLYMSLSRFALAPGGYRLTFAGTANFEKLLFGSEQYHLLGSFGSMPMAGWLLSAALALALAWGFLRYLGRRRVTAIGVAGRLASFTAAWAVATFALSNLATGGELGTALTTLFYVVVGVTLQFAIAFGLALICAQPIRGRNLFRLLFFLPLTVTPVGIAYAFRMLADMEKGPLAPLWALLGLGDVTWAANDWSARWVVLVGDSWQWIPFLFIILVAALENVPREQVEAAQIDGASSLQILRDITWPNVAPVAATVVLIRLIEAFKIVDLPNVLTSGGPGIATESMTLHSFLLWRSLDLGGSAAVAYLLLVMAIVTTLSFFQFVVRRARAGGEG